MFSLTLRQNKVVYISDGEAKTNGHELLTEALVSIYQFRNLIKIILLKYTFLIYLCKVKQAYIMKNVSLKIDDSIFGETEKILARLKKPRNRYINEAIDYYNRLQKRLLLEKKLKKESEIVKSDSMTVLKEFEEIEYVD